MSKKSGGGSVSLMKGLSRKNPYDSNKGPTMPKGSVNSDAKRTKTASTPPSLGPRKA